jgi:hypothetical protein
MRRGEKTKGIHKKFIKIIVDSSTNLEKKMPFMYLNSLQDTKQT